MGKSTGIMYTCDRCRRQIFISEQQSNPFISSNILDLTKLNYPSSSGEWTTAWDNKILCPECSDDFIKLTYMFYNGKQEEQNHG